LQEKTVSVQVMHENKANGQNACKETAVLEGKLAFINYFAPFVRRLKLLINDTDKNNGSRKHGLWWKIKKEKL